MIHITSNWDEIFASVFDATVFFSLLDYARARARSLEPTRFARHQNGQNPAPGGFLFSTSVTR